MRKSKRKDQLRADDPARRRRIASVLIEVRIFSINRQKVRSDDDDVQDLGSETLEESTESFMLDEFPNNRHTSNFRLEILVLNSSFDYI